MIIDKEKTIQKIADFLSDYINNCSLKNFWIKDHIQINSHLAVKLCEKARAKCGAEVFVSWSFPNLPPSDWPYDFAKTRTEDDDMSQCLIVSPLCRTRGVVNRSFSKHENNSDIYPLLDLYRSEVCQLAGADCGNFDNDQSEFVDRENVKNSIISSDTVPSQHPDWFKYTKSQKHLIAKMHAREKATRHKDLLSRGAIFPRIRETELVR